VIIIINIISKNNKEKTCTLIDVAIPADRIIIIMSFVTGLFFLAILLNQQWSSPLRLQASHCSTFRIMCDVPSTAVFCSESVECFIIIIIIIIIMKQDR
jgi:hypothetical protein